MKCILFLMNEDTQHEVFSADLYTFFGVCLTFPDPYMSVIYSDRFIVNFCRIFALGLQKSDYMSHLYDWPLLYCGSHLCCDITYLCTSGYYKKYCISLVLLL